MQVTRIEALRCYQVIIAGDVDAARRAITKWIDPDRPMGNVQVTRTAVHATVYIEDVDRQLIAWFRNTSEQMRANEGHMPAGGLAFYYANNPATYGSRKAS